MSVESSILVVCGKRATIGKITMKGDMLMIRDSFVNLNVQQLLDLSRLLTWWRHGKPEFESEKENEE